MVINSAQFSIQGKSEQLRRLKRERDTMIPSNKVLYARFQANREWYEYRNQLMQDALARKVPLNTATMADVPRSELTKPSIPRDLVHYRPYAR